MSGDTSSAPARVFIGIGANIDAEANITQALERLAEHVELDAVSTFYRTPAINRSDQPDYLNGVVKIHTLLQLRELKFDILRRIERELGRSRDGDKYAARPIDLDILVYGAQVVDEEAVQLPDPDLRDRPFLAAGVIELEPDFLMPDDGQPLLLPGGANELREDMEFTQAMKVRFEK